MSRIDDPLVRRSQRLLAMVHELHKQGYQELGVYPGMSPSGMHWRCAITPVSNLRLDSSGLKLISDTERLVAHHSSGDSGNLYFGWQDSRNDSARELAEKFLRRFPMIAENAKRSNWPYAGWLTELIGRTERGELPVCYSDYSNPRGYVGTTKGGRWPLPPIYAKRILNIGGTEARYISAPHLEEGSDWHTAYVEKIDAMVQGLRQSLVDLPEYPVFASEQIDESRLLFEIGAYWEGALYFLTNTLRQRDLVQATQPSGPGSTSAEESDLWRLFGAVWNHHGQIKWLHAFLVRERALKHMAAGSVDWFSSRDVGELAERTRDDSLRWLAQFVDQHQEEGLKIHNPYFGGLNPLHLGLVLEGRDASVC